MDDLIQFEMKVLDARLHEWGLPAYGSEFAAGIDLRACIDAPVAVAPQAPAVMVSSGVAILIRRPDVAAFIVPRSGLGARSGIILGQSIGTIDPDYSGPWIIPVINRNAPGTPPVTINPG
ncbi:MAG: dUTP diphosphatase, partial [Rhizobiales bacterium]|nr:dUTP diphosphatase [Hyphomicrobiales bacterium]